MNLGELKARVIQKLRERSTPRHWSIEEITENINSGVLNLLKKTNSANTNERHLALVSIDTDNGLYNYPKGIVKNGGVFWKGRELPEVTAEYLDAVVGGTEKPMQIGCPLGSGGDWRKHVDDDPKYWLHYNGKIRLYPIPRTEPVIPAPTEPTTMLKHTRDLLTGERDVVLSVQLPSDPRDVDVWIGPIWQNYDQYQIVGGNTIRFNSGMVVDSRVEVMAPFATIAGVPVVSGVTPPLFRTIAREPIAAGETSVTFSFDLPTDPVEMNVFWDVMGGYQQQDTWSVSGPTLTLGGPAVVDGEIQIVIPLVDHNDINRKRILIDVPADSTPGSTTTIVLPNQTDPGVEGIPYSYIPGTNAIDYKIGGILQFSDEITEVNANTIQVPKITFDTTVEIIIWDYFYPTPQPETFVNAHIYCQSSPVEMVADTDEPDTPANMEAYHDAIWQYALFECFSREGQEKDVGMADFYFRRFMGNVSDWLNAFSPPVIIEPRDAWTV